MMALSLVLGLAGAAELQEAEEVRLASELVRSGTVKARLAEGEADLVLLYGSEQEGRLGTCGCPARPRGGLDRADRYAEALRKDDAPVLMVNAGGYLDATPDLKGALRADTLVRGRYLLQGLDLGGWDAINLSYRDLPYQGQEGLSPLAVSANLQAPEGVDLPTHRAVQVGGLTVAITGVTEWALDHQQPAGWSVEDPLASLQALLPTLDADVVVVLAFDLDDPRSVARVPGVDVLVEANGFHTSFDPIEEGEAVWVRSRHGTQQLGELRLRVQEGRVVAATDRKIDLDADIRGTAPLRRLSRKADRELTRVLKQVLDE